MYWQDLGPPIAAEPPQGFEGPIEAPALLPQAQGGVAGEGPPVPTGTPLEFPLWAVL